MANKVIIDGAQFEIEDEQQLEKEVDWNFPDEEASVQEVKEAIRCIEEAVNHLSIANFESSLLYAKPTQCSIDSLKREIAFLAEIITITGEKK